MIERTAIRALGRVGRFAGALTRASEGGVAMIFALALPALSLMAVAGIDIHRAATVRMNLQDALDAASLAAARSSEATDAGVRTIGMRALRANLQAYPNTSLIEAAPDTDFQLNDDGTVVATAKANVTTLIANMLLGSTIKVAAASEVTRSSSKVEVALVLDNTGSMAQNGKLTATKTAATDLVNRLEAIADRSSDADAVRVSLVPFSQTVRVISGWSSGTGVSNAAQSGWLTGSNNHTGGTGDYGLFSAGRNRFSMFQTLGEGWDGCVEARPQPYDIRDTAPSNSLEDSMFVPYFAPDQPDRDDYPNDDTWQDYRSEGNNYLNDGRSGSTSWSPFSSNSAREAEWFARLRNVSKYKATTGLNSGFGPNKGCDLQPIVRLTTEFDDITDAIDDMTATGNTNVPLGMMWGWHSISPNAPFADGVDYGTRGVQKIVILMTDGENVMSSIDNPNDSSYNGLGYIWQNRLGITSGSNSTRRTRMDNRLENPTAGQEDLCTNMKAQGIIIFTIGVQVDTDAQAMLRRCSSGSEYYFNVTSTSGISTAFDRIAGSLESLRISR